MGSAAAVGSIAAHPLVSVLNVSHCSLVRSPTALVHGSVAAVMAFVTADTSGAGQRRCPLSSRSVSHRVGSGVARVIA